MVDLERMLDLATPWCLHVAATLRIPEHIAAGHAGIADLAAAAGCDADALHAVLGHLVSKGVFAEESPGRFACNQAAEQLASVPFLDLNGIGGRMAHTWGTLLNYVRTGQPAYQQVFGRPFWEDLAAHPRIGAEFDALMGPAGHGVPDFDVELSDGWEAVRTVVDVGGGTGAMLASLLRRHPQTRGILVDLPGTVARAGEIIESFGVADRMTVEGQSFFDPLPAGADLYLLKSVLNDWPDEPTVAILRRCAEAAQNRASQPSPSSAASRPTKRRARWASTCWWRAGRPARSPSSPSSPGRPAWTSSPPAPSHPAVSSVECQPRRDRTPTRLPRRPDRPAPPRWLRPSTTPAPDGPTREPAVRSLTRHPLPGASLRTAAPSPIQLRAEHSRERPLPLRCYSVIL